MTGKTHRIGGMLGGLAGFVILRDNGLLLQDVSEPLQLVMIYASSMYGSVLPDMDHHWDSAPCKDVLSWLFWRLIHLFTPIRKILQRGGKFRRKLYRKLKNSLELFDAKHRSWQTHSDLSLVVVIALAVIAPKVTGYNADGIILTILLEGMLMGYISHLFLDLITPEGVKSFILTFIRYMLGVIGGKKRKKDRGLIRLHLVPEKHFFATVEGCSPWEKLVQRILIIVCVLLLINIIYIALPYRINFVLGI